MTPDRDWLTEAIATRDLDRVTANMAAAGDRVNDARRHVRSARALADDDTPLAMAACHDAIRKAITAHMLANGLRPRGGEGAHRIVLEYARAQLGDVINEDDLEEAKEIRQDRSLAEYGDFPSRQIDGNHVRAAAEVAERIVNAVAEALARHARPSRERKR
ncbi:MAG: HEPN domain-containing protein [Actinomycetota bacterium]|nr:HEPN domain-containing protein [Actinomycetota bacterium]